MAYLRNEGRVCIQEMLDWAAKNHYKPVDERVVKEGEVIIKIIYTFQKKGGGGIRQFVFKKRGVE